MSLLWGYCTGSWAQLSAIYIITHTLAEIALWYKLGCRYSHTFGTECVHPLGHRHSSGQPQSRQSDTGDHSPETHPTEVDPSPPAINKYRVLAGNILSSNKGKRKNVDRPRQYLTWPQQSKLKDLTDNDSDPALNKPLIATKESSINGTISINFKQMTKHCSVPTMTQAVRTIEQHPKYITQSLRPTMGNTN